MDWAAAPVKRDQLVLFPSRLDEALPQSHRVRLLDGILCRLDWSNWESEYDLTRGQPPIHPRIIAGVILYGLLTRIRSSRALEEALEIRLDFHWLVEGRTIDHTTICKFRNKHHDALKDLFMQIALVARQLGCLALESLAFDGSRIRSNNRRRGSRTPARLRELKQELAKRFEELEAKVQQADHQDQEQLGDQSAHQLHQELSDVRNRKHQIDAALAELESIEASGRSVPTRLPTTDPESRIMPNKDGGYAPNYTPTATVDVDSGLLVDGDVINDINEDKQMLESVKTVEKSFGLERPPKELLADGLMCTGENIAACQQEGIDFYAPVKASEAPSLDNPAIRDDPQQPVAEALRDQLPTRTIKRDGVKYEQLDKSAFVYDADEDCYWCPEGQPLSYQTTTTEKRTDGNVRQRRRYQTSAETCVACPLNSRCLSGKAKKRMINREQHESARQAHAAKMETDQAKARYQRRCHNERPFAVIKQFFNLRQFSVRGLSRVRQEYRWAMAAFNLTRLMSLLIDKPPPNDLLDRPPTIIINP